MATNFKVHPAVGLGGVGCSLNDSFVVPERLGDPESRPLRPGGTGRSASPAGTALDSEAFPARAFTASYAGA